MVILLGLKGRAGHKTVMISWICNSQWSKLIMLLQVSTSICILSRPFFDVYLHGNNLITPHISRTDWTWISMAPKLCHRIPPKLVPGGHLRSILKLKSTWYWPKRIEDQPVQILELRSFESRLLQSTSWGKNYHQARQAHKERKPWTYHSWWTLDHL